MAGRPRGCGLLIVYDLGWERALDEGACIRILGECGFLPTGPCGVVDLSKIPPGLNAEETETFLREHGAETRNLGRAGTYDDR